MNKCCSWSFVSVLFFLNMFTFFKARSIQCIVLQDISIEPKPNENMFNGAKKMTIYRVFEKICFGFSLRNQNNVTFCNFSSRITHFRKSSFAYHYLLKKFNSYGCQAKFRETLVRCKKTNYWFAQNLCLLCSLYLCSFP